MDELRRCMVSLRIGARKVSGPPGATLFKHRNLAMDTVCQVMFDENRSWSSRKVAEVARDYELMLGLRSKNEVKAENARGNQLCCFDRAKARKSTVVLGNVGL
jgi:hypothetical protein